MEKGVDPGEGGWEVLANLVVRAAAGVLTADELRLNLPLRWSELPEDISALVSPGERTSGAGRKRAAIDVVMGPVISRVFDLYGKGQSPSDIAVLVNAEGLRTVGGRRWSTATVESTLARRYPNSEQSMTGTNVLQAELEDRWSPSVLQRRLVDLVFPSEQTLLPIVILLLLATGLPAESVRDLSVDCVTEVTPTGVRLRYLKDRAGVIAEKHFTGATPFSVAKLVETACAATADTRSRLIAMGRSEGASRLFLCATVPKQPAQPKVDSVYRFGVVNVLPANFHSTYARWIRDHGLAVGAPNDLRRLRKTRKVSRAIVLGGVVQDIADDHTTRVADQHYMCTT
ncbi:MAG: recombinase family protein, partial [Actinomycetota bacterium]|nr:recombinase family protein [Actinomycetota bacterium]